MYSSVPLGHVSSPPPRNNLLRGLNSAVPAGPDRCLESLPEIRKGSFYMHSLSILP